MGELRASARNSLFSDIKYRMDASASDFVGTWDVREAVLPDGKPAYTGTIEIRRNRHVFDLDWDITAGRYVGIGLRASSHLFVSCGEQRAGLGIALFHLQPGSRVSIQWSTPELGGATGSGEFISPFSGDFTGDHALQQRLPDGSLHGEWNLRIRKTGSLYAVDWHKGDAVHFSGIGLEMADGLAVGWYPDVRQLAFLDYTLDSRDQDTLNAIWGLGGFTALGMEKLRRE